jgi:hypothetical protein
MKPFPYEGPTNIRRNRKTLMAYRICSSVENVHAMTICCEHDNVRSRPITLLDFVFEYRSYFQLLSRILLHEVSLLVGGLVSRLQILYTHMKERKIVKPNYLFRSSLRGPFAFTCNRMDFRLVSELYWRTVIPELSLY